MKAESAPLQEMSLLDHLRELRKRIVYIAILVLAGTIISYMFADRIFGLLTSIFYQHFTGGTLIGTGPAEAFMLKIKVSVFAGMILLSPLILHQVWLFIEPGLYPPEKRLAIPFVASGTFLFFLGVWFCYAVVLPFSLKFFADEYQSIGVTPSVRISEHLSIMMQALIAFGVLFELPVMAFFLARLGIINHRMMIDSARYAIVAIFVIAGVLTPPDVFSQLLLAFPLLLLYGVSIIIVKMTENSAAQRRAPQKPTPVS